MKPVVRRMKNVRVSGVSGISISGISVMAIAVTAASSMIAVAGMFANTVQATEFGDIATVISSTPIFERVSIPRQQCYTEQVASYEERRVNRVVYDEDRRDDSRNYSRDSNRGIGAGTVLGAVIGGAIGHQFGQSSGGRDRGTAVGAILGGIVGNSAENDNRNYRDASYRNSAGNATTRRVVDVERVPVTRDVQRCQTVSDTRDEVRGYDVRYKYHGREYATRMPYDPGSTMQVNVEVRPVSRGVGGNERYEQPSAQYESRQESRHESRAPRPTYLRSY